MLDEKCLAMLSKEAGIEVIHREGYADKIVFNDGTVQDERYWRPLSPTLRLRNLKSILKSHGYSFPTVSAHKLHGVRVYEMKTKRVVACLMKKNLLNGAFDYWLSNDEKSKYK